MIGGSSDENAPPPYPYLYNDLTSESLSAERIAYTGHLSGDSIQPILS
jgi:hypothetical protein